MSEDTEESTSSEEEKYDILKDIPDDIQVQQPRMYSRIAELEVTTVGSFNQSVMDIQGVHAENFRMTVEAYMNNREELDDWQ